MAKELISILFTARDVAHKDHLATHSFSKHMALGSFYDGIIDLADKLAEAYQGKYGIMDNISTVSFKGGKTPEDKLKMLLNMFEKGRYIYMDQKDTYLQNIADEIVGLFYSTLYKLNNLK